MSEIQEHEPSSPDSLDALDLRLLRELQRDADQTNQALAERVHASPATCLRRVRRLKERGWIRRISAQLDDRCMGEVLRAIVHVNLDRQGTEHLDAFEVHASRHPAVQQCYRVAPGPDFVLIVACQGMPHWAEIARGLLTQAANVRNVKVHFCTEAPLLTWDLPLPG